ncbi:MAG: methylmalonyl Co-A mutase-associated GTPase MeaB [Alphaproteobacteria bacterium]|nr:MAG: methylmalonyl Co-A mutase-associated GTPase MeaB [Alphaproteobacteria bacterium]
MSKPTAKAKTTASDVTDVAQLAAGVRAGERRALAKAITLVESERADQQDAAEALVGELLCDTGHAVRLGLSGAPGVGKSTFIEAFGLHLTGQGHKVAVLAVDPSSSRSGGSILGDKTRMERLARDNNAFIRPSPAGETLGGVARRTREAMLVVEAAGFDVVLVETVGVGQSETAVADMVDMFALILAPGAGDELQGIKRGIMELADIVIVNKADGEWADAAQRAAADYSGALQLLRPKYNNWTAQVRLVSSLLGTGMADIWHDVEAFYEAFRESGEFDRRRADQARAWMWTEIRAGLLGTLRSHSDAMALADRLEGQVLTGALSPSAAGRQVLDAFQHNPKPR